MRRRVCKHLPSHVGGKLVPFIGLLCLLLIALALGLKASLLNRETLPIRYVRVEGVFRNLEKTEFEKALKLVVNKGYFGIDLRAVEQAGRSLAWVDEIKVERIWPDILRLRIKEQTPYFRWGDSGLLNAEGEHFSAANSKLFKELPFLNGPPGQEQVVYRAYRQMDNRLAGHGLRIASLSIDERFAWSAVLDGGAEIVLGRNAPMLAFDRFMRSLSVLGKHHFAGIESVDLRYDKGFAVSWKAGSEFDWKQVRHQGHGGEIRQVKGSINQTRRNQGMPDTASNKLKISIWRKKPTVI